MTLILAEWNTEECQALPGEGRKRRVGGRRRWERGKRKSVVKLKMKKRSFILTVSVFTIKVCQPLENEERVDSGRKRSNFFSRISNLPWKVVISKSEGQQVCK